MPGKYLVFHKDLGFPPGVRREHLAFRGPLKWSHHAQEESVKDRFGKIVQETEINTGDSSRWTPIEVKFRKKDGVLERMLVRSTPDERGNCACLVLAPQKDGSLAVVTAWINKKNDQHRTLNQKNYDDPKRF